MQKVFSEKGVLKYPSTSDMKHLCLCVDDEKEKVDKRILNVKDKFPILDLTCEDFLSKEKIYVTTSKTNEFIT